MVVNNAFASPTGPGDPAESCSSCKYYWASVDHDISWTDDNGTEQVHTFDAISSSGVCRWHPPGHHTLIANHFYRPPVHENDWCAQYTASS